MGKLSIFCHLLEKVPQTTYHAPVEEDVIAKIREENRKRAEVSFRIKIFFFCIISSFI